MFNAKTFQRSLVAIAISPIICLPVQAATITSSATCTLISAIESANSDALAGDCVAADVTGTFGDDTVIVTSEASELDSVDTSGNALGVVTSKLTIQGDGSTLTIADGTVAQQFISIEGSEADVIIDNLMLDGTGAASNIGAIGVNGGARLEIRDSTVSNNISGRPGAAIYVTGGYLKAVDTDFTNNTASGTGGALSLFQSSASISGGTMSNNSAGLGGAIFSSSSVMTIDGATLSQNVASNQGGVIFSSDSNVTVLNSNVSQNIGTNGAGAFYALSTSSSPTSTDSLRLENTILNANTSTNINGGIGAGIRANNMDVTIIGGEITANVARQSGGIDFDGNSLRSLSIDGTNISSNSAISDGGGLLIKDAVNVQIANAVIESNVSGAGPGSGPVYGGSGGGLHLASSTVTVDNSRIDLNTTDEEGGGVFIKSDVNLTINDSSVSGNSSTRSGGGIYAYGIGSSIEINLNRVGLIGNESQQSGGGLNVVYADSLSVQQSTIANNTAGNTGGGIRVVSTKFSILNTTVSNNVSAVSGGISSSAYNYGSTIYNSTIVDNQSSSAALSTSLGLIVENTVVANNGVADCSIGSGVLSGTNNWFGDDSCNGTAQGDPDLGAIPIFVQGTIGNSLVHTPNTSSGLIGAANSLFCSGTQFGFDQLGSARKVRCDIGAVETEDSGSFFVVPLPNGKSVIFEL